MVSRGLRDGVEKGTCPFCRDDSVTHILNKLPTNMKVEGDISGQEVAANKLSDSS